MTRENYMRKFSVERYSSSIFHKYKTHHWYIFTMIYIYNLMQDSFQVSTWLSAVWDFVITIRHEIRMLFNFSSQSVKAITVCRQQKVCTVTVYAHSDSIYTGRIDIIDRISVFSVTKLWLLTSSFSCECQKMIYVRRELPT